MEARTDLENAFFRVKRASDLVSGDEDYQRECQAKVQALQAQVSHIWSIFALVPTLLRTLMVKPGSGRATRAELEPQLGN